MFINEENNKETEEKDICEVGGTEYQAINLEDESNKQYDPNICLLNLIKYNGKKKGMCIYAVPFPIWKNGLWLEPKDYLCLLHITVEKFDLKIFDQEPNKAQLCDVKNCQKCEHYWNEEICNNDKKFRDNGYGTNYVEDFFKAKHKPNFSRKIIEKKGGGTRELFGHTSKSDETIVETTINPSAKARSMPRNPISPALRHEVFKRDNYKCKECGIGVETSSLHVDHILPVSQGGTDELDNLQTLCQTCNLAKNNRKWVRGNNKNGI